MTSSKVTIPGVFGTDPLAGDVADVVVVRAHSASPAAACATLTSAATVATGSLDAYDQTWTFDDINRISSRTDKLTGTATSFAYTGSKHAVVGLSGGTTATYGYNQVGAMTSRDGTTLTYDTQQRLTGYGTVESYLYGVSNQRLVRTAGTTRTLYLPGMEVTDAAGTVTVTKWLTIGGTTVGTKTVPVGGAASVAWNCGSLQNSVVCQAPAASAGTIPARKRYRPYGDERNPVTLPTTDHGFLNQPEDSTGLTYLNNRYYDPTLDNFVSVDPLVGTTGTPYLYANGSPTTLVDPSGLCGVGSVTEETAAAFAACAAGSSRLSPTDVVLERRHNMTQRAAHMSESERLDAVDRFGRASHKEDAMGAISGFVEWEISSRRIQDGDAGSPWWEITNGTLVADIQDAQYLIDHGVYEYPDAHVQAWIDYYFMDPTVVNEGEALNLDSAFWSAHQLSLYEGFGYADAFYGAELPGEQLFIQIVIGNVDFASKNILYPGSVFGKGLTWYIQYTYPDKYPAPNPPLCGCLLPGANPREPHWVGAEPPDDAMPGG